MDEMNKYGWNEHFTEAFGRYAESGFCPARVASEYKGSYRLYAPDGEMPGEISGKFRHEASGRGDLPAVGDFVAITPGFGGGSAMIHAVLPRRTVFSRAASGGVGFEQVIASNVDVAFILTSLNENFSLRRIERYLAVAFESGATPVVLLSKSDLCADVAAKAAEAEAVSAGAVVLPFSAVTGEGVASVSAYMSPGVTVAFLGSSGVGKSTLLNRLAGSDVNRTAAVREEDGRGRHTTTRRDLVLLPSGALVMDTPGMRELAIFEGASGTAAVFFDIEEAALRCRFRDCKHSGEPGCAVAEMLANGELDEARFRSYQKLAREARHAAMKNDAREADAEKRKWKAISKEVKKVMKLKYDI